MNKPMSLDLGLVDSIRINRSDVEQRANELGKRRTFKVEAQVAAYLRAVQCLDLTTLAGDDTFGRVDRLCVKALRPVGRKTLELLDVGDLNLTVGAVCVYHAMVAEAVKAVSGKIPVAAVSTGFPAGQTPMDLKKAEIQYSIYAGAKEIDVVISRPLVLTGQWEKLYQEVREFRQMCGSAVKLKTILGVGNLGTLENVAKASLVAMMAGSDFIKTSTGMEPTNATLETGLVMVREIRKFYDLTGIKVGFKPAGGIKTAKDVQLWLTLMLEELGEEWTRPQLFRIGASKLLTDLERQLWHLATGRYAANHRQPLG
jgi:deoxyribose-phosphate aldolase